MLTKVYSLTEVIDGSITDGEANGDIFLVRVMGCVEVGESYLVLFLVDSDKRRERAKVSILGVVMREMSVEGPSI